MYFALVVAVIIRPLKYNKKVCATFVSIIFPTFIVLTFTEASVNGNSAVLRTYMHHIQWAVGQKI